MLTQRQNAQSQIVTIGCSESQPMASKDCELGASGDIDRFHFYCTRTKMRAVLKNCIFIFLSLRFKSLCAGCWASRLGMQRSFAWFGQVEPLVVSARFTGNK
jgi:hypothetical protein